MADVELGFVHDFGADEEFVAERGAGARLDGEPLLARGPGYGLEVVGLEATKPELIAPIVERAAGQGLPLPRRSARSRSRSATSPPGGSTGCSAARPARSVDVAAAQLIAREAGAERRVRRASGSPRPTSASTRATTIAAALDEEMLGTLLEVQRERGGRTSVTETTVVDWGLAERTSATADRRATGSAASATRSSQRPTAQPTSRPRARRRSRPRPPTRGSGRSPSPRPPELVDRRAWARNALATLADAARAGRGAGSRPTSTCPGRSARLARRGAGAAIGAEAGLAAGYAAKRVLGQYDVALFGPGRPARLLFVAREPRARPPSSSRPTTTSSCAGSPCTRRRT